jgi:hypothetical protein
MQSAGAVSEKPKANGAGRVVARRQGVAPDAVFPPAQRAAGPRLPLGLMPNGDPAAVILWGDEDEEPKRR